MIKVYHLPYTHPNYGLFEAFLHVEEEFIPKKFFASCPFVGRPWLARPSKGHEATDFWGIYSCSTCKKVPKNAKIVDVYFSCLKFVYSGPVNCNKLQLEIS